MNFPVSLLLLISNLIPLWSKNMFCMTFTLWSVSSHGSRSLRVSCASRASFPLPEKNVTVHFSLEGRRGSWSPVLWGLCRGGRSRSPHSTPTLEPFRSRRSVWPAEGPRLCSTCPTSGSSTWWAQTPGRLPTGSSRPTSAGAQVRSGWAMRLSRLSVARAQRQRQAHPVCSGLAQLTALPLSLALGPRLQTPLPWSPSPNQGPLHLPLRPPLPTSDFVPDEIRGSRPSERSPGAGEPVHSPTRNALPIGFLEFSENARCSLTFEFEMKDE